MADNEFPRLVYKKSEGGNAQPIWNLGTFEVLECADQDAIDTAVADGWMLRPDDEPAPPKAKRAKSIAEDPAPEPAADLQPEPAPAGAALQG